MFNKKKILDSKFHFAFVSDSIFEVMAVKKYLANNNVQNNIPRK